MSYLKGSESDLSITDNHILNSNSVGLVGIAAFLISNIPSIKLILPSSELLNIFFLILLFSTASLRIYNDSRVIRAQTPLLLLLFLFVLGLTMTIPLIVFSKNFIFVYPFGYFYSITAAFVTYISINKRDVVSYVFIQYAWGLVVSIFYLVNVIEYSGVPGQHYNTVALPVTLGLLCSVMYIITYHNKYSLIMVISSVISVICLLSLGGRGPFIALPVVILLFLLSRVMTTTRISRSQVWLASIGLGSVILAIFGIIRIRLFEPSNLLIQRLIEMVADPTSESRIELYTRSISVILENPLGQGLGTFVSTDIATYPHNIILHSAYAGGWLTGFLMLVFLFVMYKLLFSALRISSFSEATIIMISFYMGFVFSISYSIHSLYMLLIPLFISLSVINSRGHTDHR